MRKNDKQETGYTTYHIGKFDNKIFKIPKKTKGLLIKFSVYVKILSKSGMTREKLAWNGVVPKYMKMFFWGEV